MVLYSQTSPAEKRTWSTRFEMRSPRFTTRLCEVPMVSAAAQ